MGAPYIYDISHLRVKSLLISIRNVRFNIEFLQFSRTVYVFMPYARTMIDYSVEIPTRCSYVTEFIIPKFFKGSTYFERYTAHHQEL